MMYITENDPITFHDWRPTHPSQDPLVTMMYKLWIKRDALYESILSRHLAGEIDDYQYYLEMGALDEYLQVATNIQNALIYGDDECTCLSDVVHEVQPCWFCRLVAHAKRLLEED